MRQLLDRALIGGGVINQGGGHCAIVSRCDSVLKEIDREYMSLINVGGFFTAHAFPRKDKRYGLAEQVTNVLEAWHALRGELLSKNARVKIQGCSFRNLLFSL